MGQAGAHGVGPADHGGGQKIANGCALLRLQARGKVFDGRQQAAAVACEDAQHALVGAAGQKLGLGVGGCRDQGHANHHIGLGPGRRRAVEVAVQVNGLVQHARRKVRGKGIGQAAFGCQLRRKQAGAQQPDGHVGARAGHGNEALARLGRRQQALQFGHVLRKVVGRLHAAAAQRAHGGGVGAGRAAQAQVDTAGVELGQRAKGFGHHQRRMVGQHHAARAHADALRAPGNVSHQHGGGRAGNAGHVVVLGQPVARKTQRFGVLRGAQGDLQRLGDGAAFAHGDQIEHGKSGAWGSSHGPIVGAARNGCCRSSGSRVFVQGRRPPVRRRCHFLVAKTPAVKQNVSNPLPPNLARCVADTLHWGKHGFFQSIFQDS